MATPSTFIFWGLSPQTASARLANTSVLGSAKSLAALRYSLSTTSGLVPLIDRFVRAVERNDLKNALVFKCLIEGRMRWMSPKVLAQAMFRVSGAGGRPKSKPPQRFSEARQSLAMTAEGLLVVRPASNRMEAAPPRDPLLGLVRRAHVLRDQDGKEERAAQLFGQAARGYEDRGEFFKATHNYFAQGQMFLVVGQWAKAIIAFAKSRLCLAKATGPLGLSVTVKTAKHYLQEGIEEAINDLGLDIADIDATTLEKVRLNVAAEIGGQGERLQGEANILKAHALYVLALLCRQFEHYDLAYQQAQLAADLFSGLNNHRDIGDAYLMMAEILKQSVAPTQTDIGRLARYFDVAARAYHDASDHEEEARLYERKARTLYEGGRFAQALSAFGEMEGAYAELKDAAKLQESQVWKLRSLARSGHVESATRSWLTTVAKYGDTTLNSELSVVSPYFKKTLALAYGEIARLYRLAGDHEKESDYFNQAGNLYLEMGEKEQAAVYYGLAGIAQEQAQQLEAARQSWQRAVTILSESGDRNFEGTLYFAIGKDYLDFGYQEMAVEMLNLAARRFRLSSDERLAEVEAILANLSQASGASH